MKRLDLTGKQIGLLTVLKIHEKKNGNIFWDCLCECGNHCYYSTGDLNRAKIKSCGCYKKHNPNKIKHGLSQTRIRDIIRDIWVNMLQRCENTNNPSYKYYGGRGIKVCEDWHNLVVFYNWAKESGYKKGLTLDRIDVNGNYEPINCRWATSETQANNTRKNVIVTYQGKSHTLAEWSKITGINYSTLYWRYKNEKDIIDLFKG